MKNKYEYFTLIDPNNPDRTAQLSVNDVATICKVKKKTAKRWLQDGQKPHASAYRLMEIYAFGEIPLLNPGMFSKLFFKQRGYNKPDQPVIVTDSNLELTASDLDWYAANQCNQMRVHARMKNEIETLKETVSDLQKANNFNVIAFAPFLRRKENYQDQQA